MATLAGWLTGEDVPEAVIKETLLKMGTVLEQHGGERALAIQPGAGLIAFSDRAYATRQQREPPLVDWVPARRTMVYRRPLSGWHALYYIQDWPGRGNLLFASEIKALFAAGVPRRIFLPALEALLRYGFIPAPWTAFADIEVVPAGSLLRWQQARLLVNEARDYSLVEGRASHDSEAESLLADLEAALVEVARGLLPVDEAPLLALSNGTGASALVTDLIAAEQTSPLYVATLSYAGDEQSLEAAEALAERLQAPLLAITGVSAPEYWLATLSALEAPAATGWPLALHQVLHTGAVESGARAALTGLGARTLLAPAPPAFADGPSSARELLHRYAQMLIPSADRERPARLWSAEAAQQLRKAPTWEETRHAQRLARRAAALKQPWQRWRYLDLHLRLPDLFVAAAQQLAAFDRLALRSPFLFPEVSDPLAQLVLQPQTPGTTRSRLLTLARHYQAAEASLLEMPLTAFFRAAREQQPEARNDLFRQLLSREALRQSGLFDVQRVATLLEDAHGAPAARELLLVFTAQLLSQLFQATL